MKLQHLQIWKRNDNKLVKIFLREEYSGDYPWLVYSVFKYNNRFFSYSVDSNGYYDHNTENSMRNLKELLSEEDYPEYYL